MLNANDQINYGKRWIADRLAMIGASAGLALDAPEWSSSSDDFRANRHTLAFRADGTRRVITFYDADIEDTQGDESVRAALEQQLQEVVRTLTAC